MKLCAVFHSTHAQNHGLPTERQPFELFCLKWTVSKLTCLWVNCLVCFYQQQSAIIVWWKHNLWLWSEQNIVGRPHTINLHHCFCWSICIHIHTILHFPDYFWYHQYCNTPMFGLLPIPHCIQGKESRDSQWDFGFHHYWYWGGWCVRLH